MDYIRNTVITLPSMASPTVNIRKTTIFKNIKITGFLIAQDVKFYLFFVGLMVYMHYKYDY
jgi:hypothetical protein